MSFITSLSSKSSATTSTVVYIVALGAFAALLIADPAGLNAVLAFVILICVLFLASLAPAYFIASKKSSKSISTLGTIALALLFTFIGFFIAAGIGWLTALSHV